MSPSPTLTPTLSQGEREENRGSNFTLTPALAQVEREEKLGVNSLSLRERAGVRVRARQLRMQSTDAEQVLWRRLRSRQLAACKFRRQHPVDVYFADFACVEIGLIVELDGGQHGLAEGLQSDARRTAVLEANGYNVLRFWNHNVLTQIDAVLQAILNFITPEDPHPSPLPEGEGVIPEGVVGFIPSPSGRGLG